MSATTERLVALRQAALELHGLLGANAHELAQGVAAILGELDAAEQIGTEAAVRNARSIYRTMSGGAGGLLDVFLAHADEEEQARVNAELDVLRRELGRLLEPARDTGERR